MNCILPQSHNIPRYSPVIQYVIIENTPLSTRKEDSKTPFADVAPNIILNSPLSARGSPLNNRSLVKGYSPLRWSRGSLLHSPGGSSLIGGSSLTGGAARHKISPQSAGSYVSSASSVPAEGLSPKPATRVSSNHLTVPRCIDPRIVSTGLAGSMLLPRQRFKPLTIYYSRTLLFKNLMGILAGSMLCHPLW